MSRSKLLNTAGYNQVAEARDGHFLYNQNDFYIGKAIARYGEFSGLELEMLTRLCAPGDIVIEVGANIGALSVPLARHLGPQGRLLCFEPQRLVFQTLCANVALNSLQNVDCHWAALGTREGTITVPEPDPTRTNNFGGVTLVGAAFGRPVTCHMLDRFINLPGVRLVKIDVEGMEADVLNGGRDFISKFKPRLYLENDRADKSEALLRLLDGLGYRMFWHTPPLFNPSNPYGESENVFGDVVSVNMVCIHRDQVVPVEGLEEVKDFTRHPTRG